MADSGGKCTFGVRAPIAIHMLNEQIYREIKHFRNYKTYTPDFKSVPVTSKFYAKHDQFDGASPEEEEKIEKYYKSIAASRLSGPKSTSEFAVTENQEYGWYLTPFFFYDRGDPRFYHPVYESPHTKIEVIIATQNPGGKKEKK